MNAAAYLEPTVSYPDFEALFEACRMVAESQGIEVPQAPEHTGRDRSAAIAAFCTANNLRHRRIALYGEWWKDDIGPFVAFRSQRDSASVAVLPCRKGYELLDPAAGLRQPIDATVAAGLESEAFVFYRSLPEGPLALSHLLRACVRGRTRDVTTLVAASICSGLLALLTPEVTRRIVNSSIPRADRIELWHMALALIVCAIAGVLIDLARGLTLLRLKSSAAVSLQAALWDRLLTLPVSFFRRFTVADLNARVMGVDRIQNALTADVTGALFSLVPAVFSLGILFVYSRPLALVAVGWALLLTLVTARLSSHQLRRLRALQQVTSRLGGLAYALLSGIAKLRVSGAERQAFALWTERFSEQRRHTNAVQRISGLQSIIAATSGAATSITLFATVGVSARLDLGVGEYMAFNAALAQFQAAAMAVIGVIPSLLALVPAYERMKPILQAGPESQGARSAISSVRGEVELRHVSFRYQDGPLVLEDVSLLARPGEFIALVGPSGSGKSTCLRLMLGFEQPEAGSVLIDGNEIGSTSMRLVRREMGVVLQNGRPMVGDIFHNIIGSLPLSMDDAWRAARFVGLEDEIRSMPMGMFTIINARGVTFSGGQRQRLLLARAVVRKPRILLLDEATSALDNRMQALVARNLEALGATRIAVAHRLSTVRHADRIYVLDRGRIVEQGTFDELIRRGGLFARMAERQML